LDALCDTPAFAARGEGSGHFAAGVLRVDVPLY